VKGVLINEFNTAIAMPGRQAMLVGSDWAVNDIELEIVTDIII
jgi:hypothetical protein